jgi:hypothetical protein
MLRETLAAISPLTAPLDQAAAKLALPPHNGPTPKLEPEAVKPKQVGKWFGAPREGSGNRWNQRLR